MWKPNNLLYISRFISDPSISAGVDQAIERHQSVDLWIAEGYFGRLQLNGFAEFAFRFISSSV